MRAPELDARVYRADTFVGELKAIADVGASGGARPFVASRSHAS